MSNTSVPIASDDLSPSSTALVALATAVDGQDTHGSCAADRFADAALAFACKTRHIAWKNLAHFRHKLGEECPVLVRVVCERRLRWLQPKQVDGVRLHRLALRWAQQGQRAPRRLSREALGTQCVRVIVLCKRAYSASHAHVHSERTW